eukprot:TRINITY_DN15661_c0_g1_i1.p1 TRINITY_DN15661_c0_g1~~TRINITY_DN15661_c0_g1_i1.p1  ORF type:complete len:192 (+),score=60.50 TRINITY_DN15661_c0_g1_i1:80-577(+)
MVKTTTACAFSGFKIYPGHGKRIIKLDSKSFNLINQKTEALFLAKKNPRKVPWTVAYRLVHKKGQQEEIQKRKSRKTQKLQRAIVGASLEEIKATRNQKPEVRLAQQSEALRKIKESKKKKAAEKASKKEVAKPAKQVKPQAKQAASKAKAKNTKGGKAPNMKGR